jgi:calmodulin
MPSSDALNEEHAGDAPPGKLTTAPSVPLMPTRVHAPLATPLPPPKAPVPLPSSASTGSPWYEDVKPFQIHRYKLRPPPMRLGMQPSILSQSRSLASLHAEATSDDSWFRSAKLARILPAPLPMPSDIPSPSVPVSRALSKAAAELGKSLAGSLKKLGDLFKRFDRDGSGSIDRLEFRLVVKELDLSASEQVCDLVFSEFDADGSGKVDYREYMVKLLRDKLASERARVMDLFRKWDIDDSGSISKSEFRRGVKAIGFEAPAAQLNALFDAMDVDRSGQLSFKELNARLRQVSYL